MSEQLHVVLGGSGSVGRALVEELLKRDRRVRAVTRSQFHDPPEGIEMVIADVSVSEGATVACAGASVVYNCVFPPTNHAVTSACASEGAKLVLADSLAMYECSSGPMSERTRYDFSDRESGRTRAELEQRLMATHRKGEVRAAIGRSSDVFGPWVIVSVMGSTVFRAALEGRPATVLGDPDMPHTYTFSRDFARALATLGDSDEADGKAWHVPSAETITTREFLSMAYGEANHDLRLRALGSTSLRLMGILSGQVRRARREKLYQFQSPFISDHSMYEATFGATTTPHAAAIRETLEWFRSY